MQQHATRPHMMHARVGSQRGTPCAMHQHSMHERQHRCQCEYVWLYIEMPAARHAGRAMMAQLAAADMQETIWQLEAAPEWGTGAR